MNTSVLREHTLTALALADALARVARIMEAGPLGRGTIDTVSLSGHLASEAGCGLALLRVVESAAAAHHLRQRVQLVGDRFVVTLSSGACS